MGNLISNALANEAAVHGWECKTSVTVPFRDGDGCQSGQQLRND